MPENSRNVPLLNLFHLGHVPSHFIQYDAKSVESTEKASAKIVAKIRDGQLGLVLLAHENPFSHMANVLRQCASASNSVVMVGRGEHLSLAQAATTISIDPEKLTLTVDDTCFSYQIVSQYDSADELLAYDAETNELCYKPSYYYAEELGQIIADGFATSGTLHGQSTEARLDSRGRIWSIGIGWPVEIAERTVSHPVAFYSAMLDYLQILKTLLMAGNEASVLRPVLIRHFAYSTLFSFSVPSLSRFLMVKSGEATVSIVTSWAADDSPIRERACLTLVAMNRLTEILQELVAGNARPSVFGDRKNEMICPASAASVVFYISLLISDIRRCVISNLQDQSGWFSEICTHRPRETAY
jgi:hypothetical protein